MTAELEPVVVAALAAMFPGWEIQHVRPGTWSAFRQSADGRSRHVLISGTAAGLAAMLQAASPER